MGFKELLVFCLLATPAMAYAASPIVCENKHTENQITSIWPTLYLADSGELCFDVKGWPEFSGKNCVANGKEIHWTGMVIVSEDGDSQGRDSTNFRVLNPGINTELIEYTTEWSRGKNWRPMQIVKINRLTGVAVSYFVTMHGGESYLCRLDRKAL